MAADEPLVGFSPSELVFRGIYRFVVVSSVVGQACTVGIDKIINSRLAVNLTKPLDYLGME
jgi:hypothetical protein